jgi:membrane dipeptidase
VPKQARPASDMLTNNHSNSSRRDFLRTTAGACSSLLIDSATWNANAQAIDPRVAQVLSKTIGVDMHNHVYPAGTEPHPQRGPQGGGTQAGSPPPDQQQGPELSLVDELKQSGLTAVCASFVLDFAHNEKPGDARTNLLHWLDAVDVQLEKGHIRRALTLNDLQAAREQHHPVIVQSVEGSHFIEGHLDRVDEVYKRGLRHLQLLHERDDMVTPLGDTNTGQAHLGGLTPFGADVVKRCNSLGIVVDMAHASHETVLATLKIATQPFIVSHTNLDTWTGSNPKMAEMMKPRLISKDHAKVIADAGGVIGVWTHLTDSLKEFVESIKTMADAIGVEHVGIGSDTDLLSSRVGSGTNRAWPSLTGGFFPAVVGEMLAQGFSPDDVAKIGGGNYCRVFGKVTSGR